MADFHYVLRCFYPEDAPKMHQLPLCSRNIHGINHDDCNDGQRQTNLSLRASSTDARLLSAHQPLQECSQRPPVINRDTSCRPQRSRLRNAHAADLVRVCPSGARLPQKRKKDELSNHNSPKNCVLGEPIGPAFLDCATHNSLRLRKECGSCDLC